ncbi:MAG: hypothetical protein ACTSWW_09140 [Promethearchaeota archaeon]
MARIDEKRERVSLYIPKSIHEFVSASCERIIVVDGKEVKFTKSLNDAYLDFIKIGIQSLEDDEEK